MKLQKDNTHSRWQLPRQLVYSHCNWVLEEAAAVAVSSAVVVVIVAVVMVVSVAEVVATEVALGVSMVMVVAL